MRDKAVMVARAGPAHDEGFAGVHVQVDAREGTTTPERISINGVQIFDLEEWEYS